MVEIEIDGRKVEVSEGSMVMHAAEKIGTFIPHFCYHKKLSIAANCRMCLVEVEKAPKALPACATPVTQGMVVRTQSERATKAQKSVMEFLLINHPLDCPICDQGGECQLQDLAVGYGGSASRYEEEKRVVFHKDVGPLVSMEEMSRCIHCTRCVRFGQEIAGVMELGMSHRGEHSEIESFVGQTVDSELSGNMIDLCPVGALTSKPFRYQARTWELGRRKSVSPHDATGANLIVQVKNHQVMRVVPYENEAVNECWIADRDRFSYEALNGEDRLTRPMIKQGGQWIETDWSAALDYVVRGLQDVHHQHGPASIGALASPHSTVEELHLMQQLIRALGSDNIDSRLRAAEPVNPQEGVRWLGMPLAELSNLQRVLIVGGNVRKDQPLMAQRIRQAARRGAQVHAIHAQVQDWAMPIRQQLVTPAADWVQALASVASAVAEIKGVPAPVQASVSETARAIAQSLCSGERKAILLGNAAAHHVRASSLLALAQWIAESTGASFGHLGEAANTLGAQVVGAVPRSKGKTATHMLQPGALKAVFLLQVEPGLDTASTGAGLADVGMVVSLSPFKANADVADVMLPISPFTETAGTFINTEGRAQSFHGVVRPLGDTRPAWKVLRVLGNLLGLQGFDQDTVEQVREQALPQGWESKLSNATRMPIDALPVNAEPVTASLYQLDGLVRRAPALQRTADAKGGH